MLRARKQFDEIQRRMDEHGINVEFTAATQLYHCLGEYSLQIGDIVQARKWAKVLHHYVAPAPDHNHLAQAYGLFARAAFAAGDRDEALAQLSSALSIVENADFPLAAWRVFCAAAEIFTQIGEPDKAATYRNRFAKVLQRLAQNFEADDRLSKSLMAALTTRTARLDAMT